ncbi:protein kinase [Paenibacillus stellifer]|uniref:Protein kinase n=1 Tax=Paenibacillus stellifer TaxID=169760 RepID=A0A089M1J7_9BACL|nr:protein kinase [Paenibacillus stellifer]AIQ65353.1 protein kinase [Paenibacillus stellifer]
MNKYSVSDSDVLEVLQINKLSTESIRKLPRSGQRQVFEVMFRNGQSSILKFIDVTPYNVYEDDISVDEFHQERAYEIDARSKRIVRELEAAKKCSVLPQLEILNGYKFYVKDQYHFIYYFETKFEGNTLNDSDVYRTDQGIEVVIDFLLQMVKQVKVMYDAGYIHRDLTPRNIIYHNGIFKIIDAGLIKTNEEEKLTGTKAIIGTPYYMAPEQERRTSDYTWDFRTDLFPLGLIAIEIFLPRTRHFGSDQIRDLHQVVSLWKKKDSSAKSITLFSKIITRLAAEQRHKRWSNLSELIIALEEISQ